MTIFSLGIQQKRSISSNTAQITQRFLFIAPSHKIVSTFLAKKTRRLLIQLGDTHQLSFIPDYIGRVWNKQVEIDVVATSKRSRTILLGECKWSKNPVNEVILDRLIQRSMLLPRIQQYKIHYALFSKHGFTTKLMDRARKEHILLFKGADFERIT